MKKYLDMHMQEIRLGSSIRCVLNGDIETVYHADEELGIMGDNLDESRSFFPLTTFGYKEISADSYMLNYFEILK